MSEETDNNEQDPIEVEVIPNGVANHLVLILMIALITAVYFCVYFAQQTRSGGQEAAQMAATKAQAEMSTATIKHDLDLRIKVVDACVAKGNIPVFINGNVDCKQAPK